jgi:hypothetical protein
MTCILKQYQMIGNQLRLKNNLNLLIMNHWWFKLVWRLSQKCNKKLDSFYQTKLTLTILMERYYHGYYKYLKKNQYDNIVLGI